MRKVKMNNLLVKILSFSLLLMLVLAPFGGLAPLMLILLGFGICSLLWSSIQAFFTADVEENHKKTGFESSGSK
jgi:putative methionine-R-sulfoxide reductase with GAF domain